MSFEAIWYATRPYPPRCRRLSRLSGRQQFGMACRLAIALHDQTAGFRPCTIELTGEWYCYWPSEPHPRRTLALARRAQEYARIRAAYDHERQRMWLLRLARRAERAADRTPGDPWNAYPDSPYGRRIAHRDIRGEIAMLRPRWIAPVRLEPGGILWLAGLGEVVADRVALRARRIPTHPQPMSLVAAVTARDPRCAPSWSW